MFLYKLVLYHVPTHRPIDATKCYPSAFEEKNKMAPWTAAKNQVDISHEKVNETQYF